MRHIWNERRRKVLDKLDHHGIAVFFSTPQFVDTMQPAFYPYLDRNFYYLTGLELPDLALLLDRDRGEAILYASPKSGEKISSDVWQEGDIRLWEQFKPDVLERCKRPGATAWFFTYERSPLEEKNQYGELAEAIAAQSGEEVLKNSFSLIKELRRKKDPVEIQNIREAIQYTQGALDYTMKNLRENGWEYEALADYMYFLSRNGSGVSFQMAASGPNALKLHYLKSDRRSLPGEMILFDVGALSHYYTSDISRTYPMNGKFSDRQRELYQIVLEAQQLASQMLRPGICYRQIDEAVKDFYGKALHAIRLIRLKEDVSRYYYHGIGHPMGLYVHDPGSMEEPVVEDGVYTIEPGLYIREEGIGIRIEDDYLVLKEGAENLSQEIVKTVSEIEEQMRMY